MDPNSQNSSALDQAFNTAGNIFNGVVKGAQNLGGDVMGAINNVANDFHQTVSNDFQQFTQQNQQAAQANQQALSQFGNTVNQGIQNIVNSPTEQALRKGAKSAPNPNEIAANLFLKPMLQGAEGYGQLLGTAAQTGVNAALEPITKNPMTIDMIPHDILQQYSSSGPYGKLQPALLGAEQTVGGVMAAATPEMIAANPLSYLKGMVGYNAALQGSGAAIQGVKQGGSLAQIVNNIVQGIAGNGQTSGPIGATFGENPVTQAGDTLLGLGLPMAHGAVEGGKVNDDTSVPLPDGIQVTRGGLKALAKIAPQVKQNIDVYNSGDPSVWQKLLPQDSFDKWWPTMDMNHTDEGSSALKNAKGSFQFIDPNDVPPQADEKSIVMNDTPFKQLVANNGHMSLPVVRQTYDEAGNPNPLEVTDGHHRFPLARSLGISKIPAVVLDDTSPITLEQAFNQTKGIVAGRNQSVNVADANQAVAQAQQSAPLLNRVITNAAQKVNGFIQLGLKQPDSLATKVANDQGRTFKNNPDTLRSTIIAPDKQSVNVALDAVKQDPEVQILKDKVKTNDQTGYSARHLQVKLPTGQRAEIQGHTPGSLVTREVSHAQYKGPEEQGVSTQLPGTQRYTGPQVGVTDQVLSKYIQNIAKDPIYSSYLKINNGDSNRALARVLEDRFSSGQVPKNIMQSIFSKTPMVQDMETGEMLDSMDSFRGEHANQLLTSLGIDMPQVNNVSNEKVSAQLPPEKTGAANEENVPTALPANPRYVAGQARLARSGSMDALDFQARTLASQMDQVLRSPEDNLNIRLAMESPEKMDEYAKQSSNPDAFKQIAQMYSNFTDNVADQIKKTGGTMNFVNDYFTHIWDLSTPEAQQIYSDLMQSRAKNFQSGFTKERLVATLQEGLAKGLQLKNTNASSDVIQYANSMGLQIGAQAFNQKLNELRPNSTASLRQAPATFVQSNVPGNQGTVIDPEVQRFMGRYNPSAFADNPIIAGTKINILGKEIPIPGIDSANQLLKQSKLAFGGFHALNTTLRQMVNDPTVIPQAIANTFSMNERNAFNQKAIDDGVINFATAHGVTFDSNQDVLPRDKTLLDTVKSANPFTKVSNAMFGGLINTYKVNLARAMMEKFPNAATDPVQEAQAQEYGKQINNLMGGLNYEAMGRNKTAQQAFRLVGLAPDFNEGIARQVLTAANPLNYAKTTMRPAALFALKNVVGQVALYAALAEVGRRLVTGQFSPNFQSFVANSVLKPSIPLPNSPAFNNPKTGRTQVANLPAPEADVMANAVSNPGQFLQARGSGLLSLGASVVQGKDYYGNPLVNPWNNTPDTIGNRISAALPNQLPIPVQNVLKQQQGAQTLPTTLLNTAGFRVSSNPNDPQTIAINKYFSGLNLASASLNPNDQKAFLGVLHPTTKDPNGNPVIDKSINLSPEKSLVLFDHQPLFDAEQKFQQSQPTHAPKWDLPPDQAKAYLAYSLVSDPATKAQIRLANPWIPQMQMKEAQYGVNVAKQNGDILQLNPPDPMQQLTQAQVKVVSAYTASPSGSVQRKTILAQNPWLVDYWNANTQYYAQHPITTSGIPQSPLNNWLASQGIATTSGGTGSSTSKGGSSSYAPAGSPQYYMNYLGREMLLQSIHGAEIPQVPLNFERTQQFNPATYAKTHVPLRVGLPQIAQNVPRVGLRVEQPPKFERVSLQRPQLAQSIRGLGQVR